MKSLTIATKQQNSFSLETYINEYKRMSKDEKGMFLTKCFATYGFIFLIVIPSFL